MKYLDSNVPSRLSSFSADAALERSGSENTINLCSSAEKAAFRCAAFPHADGLFVVERSPTTDLQQAEPEPPQTCPDLNILAVRAVATRGHQIQQTE